MANRSLVLRKAAPLVSMASIVSIIAATSGSVNTLSIMAKPSRADVVYAELFPSPFIIE
ncbi:hypothetical protein [Niastella populi]|nr:hypothetical protein [Niastella populi]